jgi:hypothetical protein
MVSAIECGRRRNPPPFQTKRTEVDFARHIKGAVAVNPEDKCIIISDNLNTHNRRLSQSPPPTRKKQARSFSEPRKNAES